MNDSIGIHDQAIFGSGKGFSDQTYMTGKLTIVLYSSDDRPKDVRQIINTVTTGGKNGAADQILAAPALNKPTNMAIGTGTPGVNALGTELNRAALTTKTRSNNIVTMTSSWAAGTGTGALTEAGIFDAGAVGNMWTSASFAVVNKGAADTLTISWDLTFG